MAGKVYYVSNAGLQRLRAQQTEIELDIVETQRLIGVTTNLDNDLRENPEYMELAVRASSVLPKKKMEINEILSKCKLFEENYKSKKEFNVVSIGDKVFVHKNNNEVENFIIGGYGDSDLSRRIISYNTPLAKAFLGKKLDEKFIVNFDSEDIEYEILLIQRGYPLEE